MSTAHSQRYFFTDILGATERVTQQDVLNKTFKTDVELEQVAVDGLVYAMISSADGKSKITSNVRFNRARIAREQQSPR